MAVNGQENPAIAERISPSMRLAEAEAFILQSYQKRVGAEDVSIASAINRILAEDVIADTDLPRFNASAVDGYAIASQGLSAGPITKFRVAGRSAAGHPWMSPVKAGHAIQIFTGAMVPPDTNLVVMQEYCEIDGPDVLIPAQGQSRNNIRFRGEDLQKGAIALTRGNRITAGHLALAATLGRATLPVHKRLRVALFSTGDEVTRQQDGIAAGNIGDANRPMLQNMLMDLGCEVDDRGILRDDPEAIIASLIAAAHDNDLIVTTGGMSVGDEDHLPGVIRRRGYLEVWKLKIKPGKPVGLGDIDDCPILALPGNPIAAAVTFLMLGTPLVARLAGSATLKPLSLILPLNCEVRKRADRWEALPARFVNREGTITAVESLAKTTSAMLSSLANADGFIALPEHVEHAQAGDAVEFVLLRR